MVPNHHGAVDDRGTVAVADDELAARAREPNQ